MENADLNSFLLATGCRTAMYDFGNGYYLLNAENGRPLNDDIRVKDENGYLIPPRDWCHLGADGVAARTVGEVLDNLAFFLPHKNADVPLRAVAAGTLIIPYLSSGMAYIGVTSKDMAKFSEMVDSVMHESTVPLPRAMASRGGCSAFRHVYGS